MRDARAWLESVRRAVAGIEPAVRELSALEDARDETLPWKARGAAAGHGQGTHGDPTAEQAERRMSELGELIAKAQARLDGLQETVGVCLRMLDDMGRELGPNHVNVIELYYVNRAETWSEVAWELGLHRNTVRAIRDESYIWLESWLIVHEMC